MFYESDKIFSRAEDRLFAREELIYNVTEDLLVAMEAKAVTKKELAQRLGKSKSFVTQVLSGARNLTLGTFSDICFALGVVPRVIVADPDSSSCWNNRPVVMLARKAVVKSSSSIAVGDAPDWDNGKAA